MSKTHKHQIIYDCMNGRREWPSAWNTMGVECVRAKFFYRLSHRQRRLRVKNLLRRGRYTEAKHLKERNVDWEIW